MIEFYKQLLDTHMNSLKVMDPSRVLNLLLLRSKFFGKYERELVEHEVTTQDKNQKILDLLSNADFDTLSEFICILSSIDHTHLDLALTVQPVRYRVLWFCPSSAQAAAVVYVLEKYARAKFSRMQRAGRDDCLVVRRGRPFPIEYKEGELKKKVESVDVLKKLLPYCHPVEVCLVFPASNDSAVVADALETSFEEEPSQKVDLFLLGNVYVGGMGGKGRVVMATQVCGGGEGEDSDILSGITDEDMSSLERALGDLAPQDLSWLNDEEPTTMDKPQVIFSPVASTTAHSDSASSAAAAADDVPTLEPCEDVMVCDPLAFKFYSLCQDKYPGKQSLVCEGVVSSEEARSKMAVISSCVLMETCSHLYCTNSSNTT